MKEELCMIVCSNPICVISQSWIIVRIPNYKIEIKHGTRVDMTKENINRAYMLTPRGSIHCITTNTLWN
jgi:hypothetical protein